MDQASDPPTLIDIADIELASIEPSSTHSKHSALKAPGVRRFCKFLDFASSFLSIKVSACNSDLDARHIQYVLTPGENATSDSFFFKVTDQ
ncbi:hypothetical protein MAR_023921, partial [Mya arenaria]